MVLANKVDITRDFVFSKISAEDVYCMELPGVQIGHAICSPLRTDKSPSMVLKVGLNEQMRHYDFVYPDDERFSGGPVDFVMSKYGLSFDSALRKIAQDFQLLEGNNKYKEITNKFIKSVMDIKRSCLIQVSARKWEKRDIEYWQQFGISLEQLKKESVYPLKEAFVNRKNVFSELESRSEIAYCYRYTNGMKLYYPTRVKSEKWKCSITNTTVEGLEQLNGQKNVIISKSKKDRLTLINCLQDYHVLIINVQNENRAAFVPEFTDKIKEKVTYLAFDSDNPGKEASLKINRDYPQYKHVNVPDRYLNEGIKDWADLYRGYGKDVIVDHFKTKKII